MRGFCLVAALAAACSAAACRGPEDCSMLGECVAGKCVCDRGFVGGNCDVADFGAAPVDGSIKRGNATWGGRPVYIDGKWHSYVADVGPCGLHYYLTYSRIIHMSSDSIDGPWTFEGEVVGTVAHNPYAVITPQGELLVYYIGAPWEAGTQDCGKAGVSPRNTSYLINVAHSPSGSPSGPWEVHPNVLEGSCPGGEGEFKWCLEMTNPAPVFHPNGTVTLALHGYTYAPGTMQQVDEVPGVTTAAHWRGPYTTPKKILTEAAPWVNETSGALMPPATFHGEDFFLWKGRRAFHMVWHVKQPFAVASKDWKSSGATAWSADGLTWHPAPHLTWNTPLAWASEPNPGVITSRQRPLLVFADQEDPYRPTHAFFGLQTCPAGTMGPEDWSWNQMVPFN
eukprot:TRINITY_DN765_c0_g1_i7.p1 TRINITY_DN765_c0_g1~~TRINITY_DN765_c0_g1_i7.p1  ORF type:complete len:395 (+),score=116.85 TRINITY_DN765_c0_g1_i7:50-1234(+)